MNPDRIEFFGRPASFESSKPSFQQMDRDAVIGLEQARKNGGPLVWFIDIRDTLTGIPLDELRTPDQNFVAKYDSDNGVHYSLIGYISEMPDPDLPESRMEFALREAISSTIPLPVFLLCLGFKDLSLPPDDTEYQLVGNIRYFYDFLASAFNNEVYLTSTTTWASGNVLDTLLGIPQLQANNIELLSEPYDDIEKWIHRLTNIPGTKRLGMSIAKSDIDPSHQPSLFV